jgi:mono/diheme cytochrome c family protein
MSSRSRLRTVARWSLRLAMGVVGLIVVAASAIYALSARDLGETFEVPEHALTVPTDSATVARGKHIATIKGCTDCHGNSFRGNIVLDDPAVGRISAPNLTNGGRGAELTDRDWERAVRHGVRRDNKPLFVMPSNEFTTISDEDMAAIVAYARSVPPVTTVMPPSKPGPVLRALHVAGQLDFRPAAEIDHKATHLASIAAEPTPEYGKYLAAGCTGCHGPGFGGGKMPGAPPDWKPAANITPKGIGHYSEADFARLIRSGTRPDGSQVDAQMPWKMLSVMSDTEISAIYRYLRTVPAKEYGISEDGAGEGVRDEVGSGLWVVGSRGTRTNKTAQCDSVALGRFLIPPYTLQPTTYNPPPTCPRYRQPPKVHQHTS